MRYKIFEQMNLTGFNCPHQTYKSASIASEQIRQNRNLIDMGTQTTVSNEQCISEESELQLVKEHLRNAENNIAYLSDRVMTYRDRWLEEYYRADNLEHHMPSNIHVAYPPQIPYGAPSPTFFSRSLDGDDEY
ncbi:uncharacterized protein F5891DRAFT_986770 [Suillus fuscotomentosus]|uniref:Uncharacterized protein n=1 Tax=Suillus fuscotomentosus TaxID=1912939 RepID=A0AAD4HDT0_9AGAM|nr:uncharacterized protein F5891DRAFT_986770 [Suillus fuscotomentosus]KAG1891581.1 hypothetical protein F5891DRAFT_986770 [Suillus fuscotomentosus]